MNTFPLRYALPRKPRIEKACGAVLYRGKKFLLLKPTKSKNWGLPRGRVEKGENEYETTRREVFEETGLKNIVFYPNFRHVNKYLMYRGQEQVERHVIFFLAESKSGEVKLSEEHSEFEWLSYDESIQRVRFPALRAILLTAAKKLDPGFKPTNTAKESDPKPQG